jgi:hypothetical protein
MYPDGSARCSTGGRRTSPPAPPAPTAPRVLATVAWIASAAFVAASSAVGPSCAGCSVARARPERRSGGWSRRRRAGGAPPARVVPGGHVVAVPRAARRASWRVRTRLGDRGHRPHGALEGPRDRDAPDSRRAACA